MINLAGNEHADNFIKSELYQAGIKIVPTINHEKHEVPYTLEGRLKNWTFKRGWLYWIAKSEKGLENNTAVELNNIPYNGERTYNSGYRGTYGDVIRLGGYAGGKELETTISNDWIREDYYHIDTQRGLNKLVEIIKKSEDKSKI